MAFAGDTALDPSDPAPRQLEVCLTLDGDVVLRLEEADRVINALTGLVAEARR